MAGFALFSDPANSFIVDAVNKYTTILIANFMVFINFSMI